jgi:hypothetical protein
MGSRIRTNDGDDSNIADAANNLFSMHRNATFRWGIFEETAYLRPGE